MYLYMYSRGAGAFVARRRGPRPSDLVFAGAVQALALLLLLQQDAGASDDDARPMEEGTESAKHAPPHSGQQSRRPRLRASVCVCGDGRGNAKRESNEHAQGGARSSRRRRKKNIAIARRRLLTKRASGRAGEACTSPRASRQDASPARIAPTPRALCAPCAHVTSSSTAKGAPASGFLRRPHERSLPWPNNRDRLSVTFVGRYGPFPRPIRPMQGAQCTTHKARRTVD